MAQRGRKPTTTPLRLVEGSHRTTRHGDMGKAKDQADKSASTFGNIVMPETLDENGRSAWERYIKPAWWLDASREATAIAFVELWSQFRKDPEGFQASKHQQLRSYMAELGLTDERNRFGVGRDKTGDEFFD